MSDDKQFDPTPSKLKKLREDGDTLKAGLIAKIIGYFGLASILLYAPVPLPQPQVAVTVQGAIQLMAHSLLWVLKVQGAILLSIGLLQLISELYISGGSMATKNIKPNTERFKINQYFAKVKDNCLQVPLKLVLALGIVLIIGYSINLELIRLNPVSGRASLALAREVLYTRSLALYTILAGLTVLTIVISYFFSYRKYMKKARMSLQEMRDEVKSTEGDPNIKGQQKEIMRELSETELVTRIKKAGVVIVED